MQYNEQISQPITADNPVGERLLDDAKVDFIEEQMMKVGSLAHSSIQWPQVESACVELLSTQTKDIKLLAVLLQCLQKDKYAKGLAQSLLVLNQFIANFWEQAYPAPGERGKLPRRRLFTMMLERSMSCAEQLVESQLTAKEQASLTECLSQLTEQAETLGLDQTLVERLAIILKPALAEPAAANSVATPAATPASSSPSSAGSSVSDNSALQLDTRNDREIKKSLLKIADFMCETELGMVQGLRLRRYGLWFSISALPPANEQGQTQLAPVSDDRIAQYQEQLKQGVDKALWRKIENSLVASPFWLEGHFLSAQVAQKLGFERAAQAIKEELQLFVARLPGIEKLSYQGGAAFISEDGLAWLQQQANSETAVANDWQEQWLQAQTLAKEGGLELALAQLNQGLSQSSEPRDAFYWRLMSADLMAQYGLTALAQNQYQSLQQQLHQMALVDWEPSLQHRVTQATDSKTE